MKIVNSNGDTVEFKPDNVTMVVPHSGGFAIMGQRIHEQVFGDLDAFMVSLPNVTNFVKLTWVGDGMVFWANVLQVKEVRPVDASTKMNYLSARADVCFLGGGNRVVTEEPYLVAQMIHEAGGADNLNNDY